MRPVGFSPPPPLLHADPSFGITLLNEQSIKFSRKSEKFFRGDGILFSAQQNQPKA